MIMMQQPSIALGSQKNPDSVFSPVKLKSWEAQKTKSLSLLLSLLISLNKPVMSCH